MEEFQGALPWWLVGTGHVSPWCCPTSQPLTFNSVQPTRTEHLHAQDTELRALPRIPRCGTSTPKPQAQASFHPLLMVAQRYSSVSELLSLVPLLFLRSPLPPSMLGTWQVLRKGFIALNEMNKSHFPLALVSEAGFHLLPA